MREDTEVIYGWSHVHVLFSSETNVLLAAVGVPRIW